VSTLLLLFHVDGCIYSIGDERLHAVSLELAREWRVDALTTISGAPYFFSLTVLFQLRVRSHLIESHDPVACDSAVPQGVVMRLNLLLLLF
jgi:hypothetical protein